MYMYMFRDNKQEDSNNISNPIIHVYLRFLGDTGDEDIGFDVVTVGSFLSIFSIVSQNDEPMSGIPPPDRSNAIR